MSKPDCVNHPSAEPLLSVADLAVRFSVRDGNGFSKPRILRAVDGVSFDIAAGTTLALVGESGCGKSTLARAILGLMPVTSGVVRFAGREVVSAARRDNPTLRREMQIVFQDPVGSLNPRMRVGEIVTEPIAAQRLAGRAERRGRAAELLNLVGLRPSDANRYPHEFSGGQRQRIGIARALASSPRLLVLDEPISALDVSIQAQILNLLEGLRAERGLTYLFIAHNLAVVRRFSDRVAVMHLGKIVEDAETEALFVRPLHPYTSALLAAVPWPDPAAPRNPAAVSGDPPSPLDLPKGCSFHTRCPHVIEECRKDSPVLRGPREAPADRLVACHLAEEISPSTGIFQKKVLEPGVPTA